MPPSSPDNKTKPDSEHIDLQGKLCPFAVMCVIRGVDGMRQGEEKTFLVDDPLATKSVPEELSEYDGITYEIEKVEKGWAISIKKDLT
ncbi:MAG: sulfurtransferase TusA family protein [Candidatus Sedimenticola sp. (ex Thyasira tokunagai)]